MNSLIILVILANTFVIALSKFGDKGGGGRRKPLDRSKSIPDDRSSWVVDIYLIQYTYARTHSQMEKNCTGSLIKEDFVLTAAYPVFENTKIPNSATFVRLPFADGAGVDRTTVKKIYSNPCSEYRCIKRFDIALLELRKPFKLNKNVGTLKLAPPLQQDNLWSDETVVSVKWDVYRKSLQYTLVTVKDYFGNIESILESENDPWLLRISDPSESQCQNSYAAGGGPLLLENPQKSFMQIGIFVHCSEENFLKSYIRVDVHREWIDAVLKTRAYVDVPCKIWNGMALEEVSIRPTTIGLSQNLLSGSKTTTSKAGLQFNSKTYWDVLLAEILVITSYCKC